jgi:RNA polymerase sigma-70 factor (ECF subfamily)
MNKIMDVLTDELSSRLLAFIHSRISNREVAADLTQEALWCAERTLALTDIEDFDDVEDTLFRIARNAVADYSFGSGDHMELRRQERGAASREGAPTQEETKLLQQLALFVRGVVDGLPDPYREALLLTDYQGLTYDELGDRLGINLLAAMSRVQQARVEVKCIIEGCFKMAADRHATVFDYQSR